MFNNIENFLLKRLSPAIAHNNFLINISEIIKKNTNIDVSEKKLKIINKTLFIKINSIRKQEVLIKKEKILQSIKDLKYKIDIEDIA